MMNGQIFNILFLCTGNSCRSQMAEGWARNLAPGQLEAHSAGVAVHGLNPLAVEVMSEVGVDISTQRSKRVDELLDVDFDCVVTVCDHAAERCPIFPGKAQLRHQAFDDPPRLAQAADGADEDRTPYRRVRDEIRDYVSALAQELTGASTGSG